MALACCRQERIVGSVVLDMFARYGEAIGG